MLGAPKKGHRIGWPFCGICGRGYTAGVNEGTQPPHSDDYAVKRFSSSALVATSSWGRW